MTQYFGFTRPCAILAALLALAGCVSATPEPTAEEARAAAFQRLHQKVGTLKPGEKVFVLPFASPNHRFTKVTGMLADAAEPHCHKLGLNLGPYVIEPAPSNRPGTPVHYLYFTCQ